MQHQNPVVPPESAVHPQNYVSTYSVHMFISEKIAIRLISVNMNLKMLTMM